MTLDLLARYAGGALAVVACFGFIIFIHELGHFIVARSVGIRCPEFAIGFGAKLFKFRWRGTEFSLRIFPFGGFVMMTGEEVESTEDSWHATISKYLSQAAFPARPGQLIAYLDELVNKTADVDKAQYAEVREHLEYSPEREYKSLPDVEGNFNNKSIPARIAVVVGGVVMNFIAALLLFWFVGLTWGVADAAMVTEPRLAAVSNNSPAKAAGFQANDTIVEVQGQPIATGDDMIKEIARYPGVPIHIKVARGKETKDFELTPNAMAGAIIFEPAGENVKVWSIDANPKSPFKVGDVITAVDGQKFNGLPAFVDLLKAKGKAPKVALEVTGRGPVDLVPPKTFKLEPEGKIGVQPGRPIRIVIVGDALGIVTGVDAGSPAEQAGFKSGDGLVKVNGRHVFGQSDLTEIFAALENKEVKVELVRGDDLEELTFNGPVGGFPALGLQLQKVDAPLVLSYGLKRVGMLIVQPYTIVWELATRQRDVKEVKDQTGGPLMIMNMIYDVSAKGLPTLLYFVALLNAAVGAFNLLPVPALDGSRLFFLVLAGIRRKEMDPDKEARIHYYGLIVLLALVALISIQDVGRIFSGTSFFK